MLLGLTCLSVCLNTKKSQHMGGADRQSPWADHPPNPFSLGLQGEGEKASQDGRWQNALICMIAGHFPSSIFCPVLLKPEGEPVAKWKKLTYYSLFHNWVWNWRLASDPVGLQKRKLQNSLPVQVIGVRQFVRKFHFSSQVFIDNNIQLLLLLNFCMP